MSIENKMPFKTIKGIIPSNKITIIIIVGKVAMGHRPIGSLSHTHDCNVNNIVHCVYKLFIVHCIATKIGAIPAARANVFSVPCAHCTWTFYDILITCMAYQLPAV